MGLPLSWLLALALAARGGEAPWLVVFTDGGFLPAESVELVEGSRLRLSLPAGGWLEVPLGRVERVVEAQVEEQSPSPSPPPAPCSPFFSQEPMPAGTPFAKELQEAGKKHNLHPRLLAAVAEVESGFNPFAVSPVGARGLMQLMPAVWVAEGLLEPHDPQQNVLAGAAHLQRLLQRFGRLDWALAAYNAGASVVQSYGGIPPYRETRAFVRAVLSRFCP
jgi:hypothetical protein